ncbi:hypothetical protein NC653_002539 [Populus alba x Populus x berolinensis]|uniref:Uncharacterized protein n=1 Tax=Populus alba x Populus x berolinensis TaxID=444605 RepID=A0AAD6WHH8_9ROSI|nr:hypothetical protein NC653_002539 [Populus alba x Populus x berolinensis]
MSMEEAGMRGLMHEEQSNVESKHTAPVPFVPATLILASPNSTFCVLICFLLGIFRHIYLFTIAAFLIAEGNSEQSGGQQALKCLASDSFLESMTTCWKLGLVAEWYQPSYFSRGKLGSESPFGLKAGPFCYRGPLATVFAFHSPITSAHRPWTARFYP